MSAVLAGTSCTLPPISPLSQHSMVAIRLLVARAATVGFVAGFAPDHRSYQVYSISIRRLSSKQTRDVSSASSSWAISSQLQSDDEIDMNDSDGSSLNNVNVGTAIPQSAITSPNTLPTNSNRPLPFPDAMRLMGTSPRRIFLSMSSSTAIALAANLFDITSNILSALPEEFSESTGLDTFYPRGEFKRVIVRSSSSFASSAGKCSFLIPKDWVADTSLALAQAQRQAKSLDMSMGSGRGGGFLPDGAYGPPGRLDSQGLSNGDTNVSVIINNEVKNFSLKGTLGSDAELAVRDLLKLRKRPTTLVSAFEEVRGETNTLVYQFEYIIDRGERAKPLHAMSVVAGSSAGDAFVTMTVVSPEEEWEKPNVAEKLRRIATSFKLV